MSDDQTPRDLIAQIAKSAKAIGFQAGIGAMETAGSIVSFLDSNPEHIDAFVSGATSVMDWPENWHELGELSWHCRDGSVRTPAEARAYRAQFARSEKGS